MCLECGKNSVVYPFKLLCSLECRKVRKEKREKGLIPPIFLNCNFCGERFHSKSGSKSCSEDCRKQFTKKYNKAYWPKGKISLKKSQEKHKKKRNAECLANYHSNKERYNARALKYCNAKRKLDRQFHLAMNLRGRFYQALKRKYKKGSAVKMLGCTIEEFQIYIEKKFTEGMSWDNYGKWHLDHILPLSRFDLTSIENLTVLLHYTNYQPMWPSDNIRKGDKILISTTIQPKT